MNMKTKIVFLMVCWLSIASCFGEWTSDYRWGGNHVTDGNVVIHYYIDATNIYPWEATGKYIAGVRFIITSPCDLDGRTSNVYYGFHNERDEIVSDGWIGTFNNPSDMFSGSPDSRANILYTFTCPSPAVKVRLHNTAHPFYGGPATYAYLEVDVRDYSAEMPTITPPGGIVPPGQSVLITTSQVSDGATISYTLDGTDPTVSGKPYADGIINLNADTTVKAVAYYKGLTSPINTKTFQIGWWPPEIFPPSGGFQIGDEVEVTITNSPNNNGEGTILFRYNYGASQTSWTEYVNPILVTETSTIEAKVAGIGRESAVVSATYEFVLEKVDTPVISPTGGAFEELPSVEISCATPGATIYYTVNGSEPSKTSSTYTGSISLAGSCRVKAFAVKTNMGDSDKVSRAYVLNDPLPKGNGSDSGYSKYLDDRGGLFDQLGTPPNDGTLDDIIRLDDDWKNTGSGGGTGTGGGSGGGTGTGGGTGGGTGDGGGAGGGTGGGTGNGGTGDGNGDGNTGGGTGDGGTDGGGSGTGTGNGGGTSGGGTTSTTTNNEGDSNYYSTSNTYNTYDNNSDAESTDYLGLGSILAVGVLPLIMKPEPHPSINGRDFSNEEENDDDSWAKRIFFTK